MSNKKEIRKMVTDARATLDFDTKRKFDKEIYTNFMNNELVKNAKSIAIYHSTDDEVNTTAIIYTLLQQGKEVSLPRVEDKIMSMRIIDDIAFKYDKYFGIRQPAKDSTIILAKDIDLLVVPGVAFDLSKNRLGLGGGFYDKYISEYKGKTIMLAYELQKILNVPNDKYDQKVDFIITNKTTY